MLVAWRDIAFAPGKALAAAIVEQWQWRTQRSDLVPFLCSMLGDVFAEDAHGAVHWLCCAGDQFERIAPNRAEFDRLCQEDETRRNEWFGPALIERLHEAGKRAEPGQCYMFKTLPIFSDCQYIPANIAVVPVDDVFIGLSEVMQLYEGLPDKQKRRLHLFE